MHNIQTVAFNLDVEMYYNDLIVLIKMAVCLFYRAKSGKGCWLYLRTLAVKMPKQAPTSTPSSAIWDP